MFLHLGEDIVLQTKEIVAIIDSNLAEESEILKEFIDVNNKKNNIVHISDGTVKSIVVTENKVYFSPLTAVTLKRRSQYIYELEMVSE
ncbi:hypothetical protein M670_02770 [Schinkia azotoformans MEV2011]|uniref:DUF370 domain-containing protein n=2 Tax=Schinkia azotoformans TaxID=1454 RepID=K6DK79_SCHAZ|nr:extracellular matrix/biofilm biosynthesis regulator RemA family protein [Schinkia azotoformans]EKN68724.1 hypothetical protein BAZO_03061 [Schinkia azotoformans LMG 9581]KEF38011.1 hypothetical protein M670_02770 [Schinkia azotoformans MEV2011]MEC1639049.1 DUF370 domain-containing protein [Schinkia azotoformans]MEC1695821.1 DUF370 domain-containing protein [Schinkia azotoformans]MEC1717273.1 DUF370 domain-containing protein [Schinkia azotoformans]